VKRFALAMLLILLGDPSPAEDAKPPRLIAPERFAPSYRETPADAPAPSPSERAPSAEHPLGACKRGARDWMPCLDAAARLGDEQVDQAEARVIAGLERRVGMNSVTRGGMATALKAANEEWRALRVRECGPLALIESGVGGPLSEARLVCRIRRDLERVDALDRRYGTAP
jgi:hypothetical protein